VLHLAQATALVPAVATTQPVRIPACLASHPDKAGDLRPVRMPRTKPKERAPTQATYRLRVSCQNLRVTKRPRANTQRKRQLNRHFKFFFLLNKPLMPSRAAGKFVPTSDAVKSSNLSRVFAVDEARSPCSRRRKAYGNTQRKEWRTKDGRHRREGPGFSATPHKKRTEAAMRPTLRSDCEAGLAFGPG